MDRKTRVFWGAFAITVILIGALCGFVAVDLSTDRYMPNQFGPFFEIMSIEPDSISYHFLAKAYVLDTQALDVLFGKLDEYRGLLPPEPRIASALAEPGASYIIQKIGAGH